MPVVFKLFLSPFFLTSFYFRCSVEASFCFRFEPCSKKGTISVSPCSEKHCTDVVSALDVTARHLRPVWRACLFTFAASSPQWFPYMQMSLGNMRINRTLCCGTRPFCFIYIYVFFSLLSRMRLWCIKVRLPFRVECVVGDVSTWLLRHRILVALSVSVAPRGHSCVTRVENESPLPSSSDDHQLHLGRDRRTHDGS